MKGAKAISGVMIIITILWCSYAASEKFYFAQVEENMQERTERLEALKRSNDENERLKENSEELELNLKLAESEYDSLKRLIPDEAELPRVFDWIAKRALERNLKLEHFSQSSLVNPNAQQQATIVEVSLQVEALGYYDAVERFLEDF